MSAGSGLSNAEAIATTRMSRETLLAADANLACRCASAPCAPVSTLSAYEQLLRSWLIHHEGHCCVREDDHAVEWTLRHLRAHHRDGSACGDPQ